MKKTVFVLLLACAVLTAAWAGGAKEKKAADGGYTFKIGYGITVGLCAAPFYIAIEQNLFEAEGLKWERISVGDGESLNLLTTGQMDAGNNLLATLIQPLANGLDVKIPLALHTGCVKVLVSPGSPIKTVADLRGKKIGAASPASSGTIIAKRYLAHEGLRVDGANPDVEFIYQTNAELPLLLERGVVDAIALGDPTAQIIENEGKGRVVINSATDDYLHDEFCCVIAVRSEIIQKYPEETAKFLRAIQKAAYFVQEHPEETARLLGEKNLLAGDPEVNGQILATYDYRASVSQALPAIRRNARDLQALGLVAADVDVEALVNNTYIEVPGVPDSLFK
jgi:NitT/TauT family transport system substrate-binding protein